MLQKNVSVGGTIRKSALIRQKEEEEERKNGLVYTSRRAHLVLFSFATMKESIQTAGVYRKVAHRRTVPMFHLLEKKKVKEVNAKQRRSFVRLPLEASSKILFKNAYSFNWNFF